MIDRFQPNPARGLRWGRSRSVVLIATGLALIGGAATGSPTVAACGPVLVGIGFIEWRRRAALSAAGRAGDELVAAVDHLIQQLRSGLSLRRSCETLSGAVSQTSAPDVVAVARGLEAGMTLADAAGGLRSHPDCSLRLFGVTVETLAGNGGPAVPALQRLRMTVVAAAQARAQAEVEAAQATASAALLALAPLVFAAVVASLDRSAARLYLEEPFGLVCLVASLMLSALGWWWIQSTVSRVVRRAL